ncbi:hypothetical protein GJ699_18595 [Duganella sp. FT80W]|uniref:Uncharacterized protein n=1 Tax=Duganella guangzhouensis TaxID=2666084 RepID=A0A6I2L5R7_9BURK|nr:hypothetical protein [Duganella guangzhouensis]MRW92006.1 hypothetical protein [Duganella guangzhouensis]
MMISVTDMLNRIARDGLGYADPEDVIHIAKSVWYYDLIPDLSAVNGPFRNDVGYLFDCLARFNVLTKERKLALIDAVAPYKPACPMPSENCLDPRAIAWGASYDLKAFMGDILPFQTRHYAAGHGW